MKNTFAVVASSLGLVFALLPAVQASTSSVEIRLIDNIDEPRGYCLDVAGGRGADAPLDKGLQAHTCYDYSGSLLEDQSFDANLLAEGQFKLPYFDVCMAVPAVELNANLVLEACAGGPTQGFSLQADGRLVSNENPDLCVTVNSSQRREGRGGEPVHVMRPLSLQECSEDAKVYQRWTLFSL